MTTSPLHDNIDLISYQILLNGSKISDTIEVHSIFVDLTTEFEPTAEIELLVHQSIGNEFANFAIDGHIEIRLGYHAKEEPVFKGHIVSQSFTTDEDGNAVLVLACETSDTHHKVTPPAEPTLLITYGIDVIDFDLNIYKTEEGSNEHACAVLFQGSSKIQPGHKLQLNGFPTSFNRNYTAVDVTHLVSEGQWTTEVGLI